jgi:N-acetylmuramoyl-L-alanine amidase
VTPQEVRYIVVHCSATRPSQDIDWHTIDAWHRAKGWLCIGYHHVIKRDGTIETTPRVVNTDGPGSPTYNAGAHVEGYNHCSIGICLVGGVAEKDVDKAEDNFTEDQKQSLAQKILELRILFPAAVVQGHRDFPDVKKDCPSFAVKDWLKSVGL